MGTYKSSRSPSSSAVLSSASSQDYSVSLGARPPSDTSSFAPQTRRSLCGSRTRENRGMFLFARRVALFGPRWGIWRWR